MSNDRSILVVDDEEVMRVSLAAWLREDGFQVDLAASGDEAIALARRKPFAVCFLDLKMPGGPDGLETMRELRAIDPELTVVIMTAYASIDTAVTAIREGAEEYLVKPFDPDQVSLLVGRIERIKSLERDNEMLRRKLSGQYRFHELISKSPRMQEVFTLIQEVAGLRSTVLILGESGTGKELVARAIHAAGDRAEGPFLAVPCGALAEGVLESELFGHERGAFTGATGRRPGKFELADGGTLLLDEIGDISPKVQVDLLRVLQERRFFRVGGTEEVAVDVRVIAATNVDLHQAVRDGRFRGDLLYRLDVVSIRVPPLRERMEDIPILANEFLGRLAPELGKRVDRIGDGALKLLLEHDWPGNVRELENVVERALITARGPVLEAEDLSFLRRAEQPRGGWEPPTTLSLAAVEREVIVATLRRLGGNVRRTAEVLGIDRSTLYDRLRRYGLR